MDADKNSHEFKMDLKLFTGNKINLSPLIEIRINCPQEKVSKLFLNEKGCAS